MIDLENDKVILKKLMLYLGILCTHIKVVYFMKSRILMQELFSKQKGFLEEELDYRKQALDQAYMVGSLYRSDLLCLTEFTLENILNKIVFFFL